MKTGISLIVVGTVVVAGSVTNYRKVRRQELEKRAKIVAEGQAQIQAIIRARDILLHQIETGQYDGDIRTIHTDLTFYTIAQREQ